MTLSGQNVPSSKIVFLNTPVLYKEGGKSYQQVIASYRAEKAGKIVFTKDGKELLKAGLKDGDNKFLLSTCCYQICQDNHICKDRQQDYGEISGYYCSSEKMANLLCPAFTYRYWLYTSTVGNSCRTHALY